MSTCSANSSNPMIMCVAGMAKFVAATGIDDEM
jgi:hypothetical protein